MRTKEYLSKARSNKNDEFYTRYIDIENEIQHYKDFLKDKIIYCNCDDFYISNFFKYFYDNFQDLKLKKLITTSYNKEGKGNYSEFDGETLKTGELTTEGSFDSEESLQYLQQADVIITNPPFSLFRKYIQLLFDNNKKFLIIGNVNAAGYKEIFPYIINNQLWFGHRFNGTYYYHIPPELEIVQVGGSAWYTNIETNKNLILNTTAEFETDKYEKFDNYDAININSLKDFPKNYHKEIGTPITALKYMNDDGTITTSENLKYKVTRLKKGIDGKDLRIDGKTKYVRIILTPL